MFRRAYKRECDVADAALHLTSDEDDFITGVAFQVAGAASEGRLAL